MGIQCSFPALHCYSAHLSITHLEQMFWLALIFTKVLLFDICRSWQNIACMCSLQKLRSGYVSWVISMVADWCLCWTVLRVEAVTILNYAQFLVHCFVSSGKSFWQIYYDPPFFHNALDRQMDRPSTGRSFTGKFDDRSHIGRCSTRATRPNNSN